MKDLEKQENKKRKKLLKKYFSEATKGTVKLQPITVETRSGKLQERHLLPQNIEEALTKSEINKKTTLIARIGSSFFGWMKDNTDLADDEGTTELGATAGSAVGYLSQDFHDQMKLETTRSAKYKDYRKIDNECVELSRALEVTNANVFTSSDGDQESYLLGSKDSKVLSILEDLDTRLDMPEELPKIIKSGLQYGDEFEEVVFDSAFALTRIKWLNPEFTFRNEDEYGRLNSEEAFTMMDSGGHKVASFKPWQVIHLRHNHQRGDLYGRSFWFSSRYPWRLIKMMEDGVVMGRLISAIEELVYKIPMPKNMNPRDADKEMQKQIDKLRRKKQVDESGKISVRSKATPDRTEIFMATVDGLPEPSVERLRGSSIIGELRDVEYIQNKLFTSTGVPKSYLGLERDVNSKATLSWQDIQYARQLRKIQKEAAWFQHQVYDRQLLMLGYIPEKDLYTITYPPISFIDEELKTTIMNLKWEIALIAQQMRLPLDWVLKNIVDIPVDEVDDIVANIVVTPEPDTKIPDSKEEMSLRDKVFSDMRLMRNINEFKAMLKVIIKDRLHKSVDL